MAEMSGNSVPVTSLDVGNSESGQERKDTKFWLDPEEYSLRKRLPPSLPRRNCDVYVTNKTQFKAQLDRCQRLIDEKLNTNESQGSTGDKELVPEQIVLVYLHSLGAAIPRALNLALQLEKKYGSQIQLENITSTVELTDDFEPILPENGGSRGSKTHTRYNSAVHIKISQCPAARSSGPEIGGGNPSVTQLEQ